MARGKNISHHCNHCERITKMEMVGSVESQPDKTWYRCTRCRHASLIDVNSLRKLQEESKRTPEKIDCTEYRPDGTYTVGQAIFHSGWDDVGKIISKERTSRGEHAIVVSFEKHGERRLLESVAEGAE
jgi:hypothetical protein